jgi:hypothetical protein
MVSGLARSPAIPATGSPGRDRIKIKVMRVMPRRVGMKRRILFRR